MTTPTTRRTSPAARSEVHGHADEGYGALADVFHDSFERGLELGGAVAVYRDGRPVVDLWGGIADRSLGRAWSRDTATVIFSCTKGLMAICAYRLVEDGLLDLDAPVSRYWPEFARHGKERTTVRWLLSHRAGLPVLDAQLSRDEALSWTPVVRAIEDQAPLWEPGSAYAYHAKTFGWLVGEVIHRVTGRTPGAYFRSVVGEPLGLRTWIGLPDTENDVARTEPPPVADEPLAPDGIDVEAAEIARRAVTLNGLFPFPDTDGFVTYNDPRIRAAELPGGNGISTARDLARSYAACVGEIDGIRLMRRDSIDDALRMQSSGDPAYGPTGGSLRWGTGFMLHSPPYRPMLGRTSFGHDGAGGQLAFADVEHGVAFAYVTNQMGAANDDRAQRLITALTESVGT
jgi:CubicO group peptidase (beta-lactamase class C family)